MKEKIGIIGFGNMGSAIAEQLKVNYQVIVFDKDQTRVAGLSAIETVNSIVTLCDNSQAVILAVKPQDLDSVLDEIKGYKHILDKLFISIAAGITTEYIEKRLGVVRIVRAMPNIGAKIGSSITCISRGKEATDEDLDFTDDLFEYIGEVKEIDEDMMDAATAVSGSGPGYFFYFLQVKKIDIKDIVAVTKFAREEFAPALQTAAHKSGFNLNDAEYLSATTAGTCISFARMGNFSAEELEKQVTSKGGTTEAGLKVLRDNGSLSDAVCAAKKRAVELSKKE
jgi:pyrroline-5-carboxylate reductase